MSVDLPSWFRVVPAGTAFGCSTHCGVLADVRSHRVGVEGDPDTGETQRTPEGVATFRKREASRVGM
jgi:hypothetical protein